MELKDIPQPVDELIEQIVLIGPGAGQFGIVARKAAHGRYVVVLLRASNFLFCYAHPSELEIQHSSRITPAMEEELEQQLAEYRRRCGTKLDGKFYGRIFREKDDSEVPADSFMVFLARDRALLPTLEFYFSRCLSLGAGQPQLQAVSDLIKRVEAWQAAHPDQMKVADVDPGEINIEARPWK